MLDNFESNKKAKGDNKIENNDSKNIKVEKNNQKANILSEPFTVVQNYEREKIESNEIFLNSPKILQMAYMQFASDHYHKIKSRYAYLSNDPVELSKEVKKLIQILWSSCSMLERAKYIQYAMSFYTKSDAQLSLDLDREVDSSVTPPSQEPILHKEIISSSTTHFSHSISSEKDQVMSQYSHRPLNPFLLSHPPMIYDPFPIHISLPATPSHSFNRHPQPTKKRKIDSNANK